MTSLNHFTCFPLALFLVTSVYAENEAHYRSLFAKSVSGREEVTLPDKTRCDVVTAFHAVEVEKGRKWQESLSQALWYGFQLDKEPGIVLILEDEKDRRFLIRLMSLIKHREMDDVTVWTITKDRVITEETSTKLEK